MDNAKTLRVKQEEKVEERYRDSLFLDSYRLPSVQNGHRLLYFLIKSKLNITLTEISFTGLIFLSSYIWWMDLTIRIRSASGSNGPAILSILLKRRYNQISEIDVVSTKVKYEMSNLCFQTNTWHSEATTAS